MAQLTVFKIPTMNAENYAQCLKGLEEAGQGNPKGRMYHVASPLENGGFLITDVWESQELLDAFGKTLIPVMERAGVKPVEPEVYAIHNILKDNYVAGEKSSLIIIPKRYTKNRQKSLKTVLPKLLLKPKI